MDKKELHRIMENASCTLPFCYEYGSDGFLTPSLKRLRPRKTDVLHRETCPACGCKRVNLYRYGNEWLCRVCRDAAIKIDAEVER